MKEHKRIKRGNNKEIFTKVFGTLETVLFVTVFTILCIMLYSLHKYQSVSLFNYKFLRIVSDSMEPTFASGSCIIVKKTNPDKLQPGDIVTFISHDDRIYEEYNTHRIYEIKTDKNGEVVFITKGDKFSSPDDKTVRKNDIIGKYVCKVPFSKVINFLIIKLSNSMVYFVIIIIPLILCLLSYIKQLMRILVFGDMNYKKTKANDKIKANNKINKRTKKTQIKNNDKTKADNEAKLNNRTKDNKVKDNKVKDNDKKC